MSRNININVNRKKGMSIGWILFHTFMVFVTAGIWLIPLLIWYIGKSR